MINLIEVELRKYFLKKSTFFIIAFLAAFIILTAAYLKVTTSTDIKQDLNTEIEELNQSNEEIEKNLQEEESTKFQEIYNDMHKNNDEKITILRYAVDNDISYKQNSSISLANKMIDFSFFIIIFIICIASNSICNEFASGTIKYICIRPVSRKKILLSKCLMTMIVSVITTLFIFVFSSIVGYILFGVFTDNNIYIDSSGSIVVENIINSTVMKYLSLIVDLIVIIAITFLISIITTNNSITIISIIAFYIGGNMISNVLKNKEFAKYILFSNMNLAQYLPGQIPKVLDNNLIFSMSIIFIYVAVFYVLASVIFSRKEIN